MREGKGGLAFKRDGENVGMEKRSGWCLPTSSKIFQSLQTVITNIESFQNSAQFSKF